MHASRPARYRLFAVAFFRPVSVNFPFPLRRTYRLSPRGAISVRLLELFFPPDFLADELFFFDADFLVDERLVTATMVLLQKGCTVHAQ